MKRSYIIVSVIIIYMASHISWSVLFNVNQFQQQCNTSLIITGHRGAADLAPENTWASVYKGLNTNAKRVEIDVRLSVDGRVMVIHDATVNRTTDGSGFINEMNYDSLKKLNAGSWFSPIYSSESIPTLEEVLHIFDPQKELIIEIKADRNESFSIENKVVNIIKDHNALEYCIIQSFDIDVLRRIDSLESKIKLHKLIIGKLHFLPIYFGEKLEYMNLNNYSFIDEVSIHYCFANRKTIEDIKSLGKNINAWTVDDLKKAKQLCNNGIDGIITNNPHLIRDNLINVCP